MYELHGWFNLAESTIESDVGSLEVNIQLIARVIEERFVWSNIRAQLMALNGEYKLTVTGYVNRPRDEVIAVHDLIDLVAVKLPGSWGLLYERDSDIVEGPGVNAYRVTVLARGRTERRDDPFLSPCNPVFED